MAVFLQVLEGEIPEEAEPLFATRDARILQLVADELSRRLGVDARPPKPALDFLRAVGNPKEADKEDSPEAGSGE